MFPRYNYEFDQFADDDYNPSIKSLPLCLVALFVQGYLTL